jgi:hypothetical protein
VSEPSGSERRLSRRHGSSPTSSSSDVARARLLPRRPAEAPRTCRPFCASGRSS